MGDAALKVVARRVTMAIRAPAVQRLTVKAPSPVRLTVKPRIRLVMGVPKQGPPGPAGQNGVDGGNLTYTFAFPAPLAVWLVAHDLGRFPSVTVLDTAGDQVLGDLSYLDANTLRVTFGLPMAGVAYLN